MKIKETLKEITPYRGGPSKRDVSQKYGLKEEEIIKLSSNENPLGISERVVEAIRQTDTSTLNIYPDTFTTELRKKLSEELDVAPENLLFGCGCDEVLQIALQALVEKGDEVIIQSPTFPVYESILKPLGAKIKMVPLNSDFSFNLESFLEACEGKNALICNPNNPTGTIVSPEELSAILEVANYLILDETYYLFSGQSSLPLLKKYDNLLICRSFSKDYGLTGLRIGYGVGSPTLLQEMEKIRLPYNINTLAEKAAIAALDDKDFIKKTIETIEDGRKYLTENLKKIGYKTYPSGGNFVLIQVEDSDSFTDSLMQKGISVRNYGRYEGFEKSYVRISVGTPEQNEKLIGALREKEK